MNWIGWVILSVLSTMMLFLLVIPFVVLGFYWGIFVFIVSYLYMCGLLWMVGEGAVSYLDVIKLPYELIKEKIKGE